MSGIDLGLRYQDESSGDALGSESRWHEGTLTSPGTQLCTETASLFLSVVKFSRHGNMHKVCTYVPL